MKSKKVVDEVKMREYIEVLDVIKDTIGERDRASICLNNYTLKTLAGYTQDSTDDNFNLYIKDYLDKMSYDEHNRKVGEAKKIKDVEKLQELSNEIMGMAGYTEEPVSERNVNQYAKSFVDRTLLDRKFSKLYKALETGEEENIAQAYKEIYSMTNYSENRPYGVVNQYAQTFVDSRIDDFIQRGIHIPVIRDERAQYAI